MRESMIQSPINVRPLHPSNEVNPPKEVLYVRPTLDELFELCSDFKLISDVRNDGDGYQIQCKEELFSVTAQEASILVRGLLIGHFAFHTRDDLSLANWID